MKKKQPLKQTELYPDGELPRVKTPGNFHLFPRKGEINDDPSETIPNQSMSVLEMIRRHKSGLPIDGNIRTPLYEGEDGFPDISDMDLADQQAIVEAMADKLADIKYKIQEENKSEAARKKIEEIEHEVSKRLKALQQQVNAPAPSAGQKTE